MAFNEFLKIAQRIAVRRATQKNMELGYLYCSELESAYRFDGITEIIKGEPLLMVTDTMMSGTTLVIPVSMELAAQAARASA